MLVNARPQAVQLHENITPLNLLPTKIFDYLFSEMYEILYTQFFMFTVNGSNHKVVACYLGR